MVGRTNYDAVILDYGRYSLNFGHAETHEDPEVAWRLGWDFETPLIEKGVVRNFDEFEHFTKKGFETLNHNSFTSPVLFCDYPGNPFSNREKISEVLFEKFDVPSVWFSQKTILETYSVGLTSAFVLRSGDHVSATSIVFEGHTVPAVTKRIALGGNDVNEALISSLSLSHSLSTSDTYNLKEKICEVCPSKKVFNTLDTEKIHSVKLPDGEDIQIKSWQAFVPGEAQYRPAILDDTKPGFQTLLKNSVEEIPVDLKPILFNHFYVTGGNMKLKGNVQRLEKLVKKKIKNVKSLLQPPDLESACFLGGSIVASLDNFKGMGLSKAVYEEYGAHCVHEVCY
eukprot:augustus_masked-scaffold_5-processed-gene-1.9-mRNA-1 protein AED:0.40 eAED:0.40 QI:0/-1/0/1/-1/1/1/0/339